VVRANVEQAGTHALTFVGFREVPSYRMPPTYELHLVAEVRFGPGPLIA
jgi:hypothetical protein